MWGGGNKSKNGNHLQAIELDVMAFVEVAILGITR